ncbi:MAG: hypothetical protein AAGU75_23545 [Bacillota bacterium]
MKSNLEMYQAIEKMIDSLENKYESQWSFKLKSAMFSDSTAGEIPGKIRCTLYELQTTDLPEKLKFEDEILKSLIFIDSLLGPHR